MGLWLFTIFVALLWGQKIWGSGRLSQALLTGLGTVSPSRGSMWAIWWGPGAGLLLESLGSPVLGWVESLVHVIQSGPGHSWDLSWWVPALEHGFARGDWEPGVAGVIRGHGSWLVLRWAGNLCSRESGRARCHERQHVLEWVRSLGSWEPAGSQELWDEPGVAGASRCCFKVEAWVPGKLLVPGALGAVGGHLSQQAHVLVGDLVLEGPARSLFPWELPGAAGPVRCPGETWAWVPRSPSGAWCPGICLGSLESVNAEVSWGPGLSEPTGSPAMEAAWGHGRRQALRQPQCGSSTTHQEPGPRDKTWGHGSHLGLLKMAGTRLRWGPGFLEPAESLVPRTLLEATRAGVSQGEPGACVCRSMQGASRCIGVSLLLGRPALRLRWSRALTPSPPCGRFVITDSASFSVTGLFSCLFPHGWDWVGCF